MFEGLVGKERKKAVGVLPFTGALLKKNERKRCSGARLGAGKLDPRPANLTSSSMDAENPSLKRRRKRGRKREADADEISLAAEIQPP